MEYDLIKIAKTIDMEKVHDFLTSDEVLEQFKRCYTQDLQGMHFAVLGYPGNIFALSGPRTTGSSTMDEYNEKALRLCTFDCNQELIGIGEDFLDSLSLEKVKLVFDEFKEREPNILATFDKAIEMFPEEFHEYLNDCIEEELETEIDLLKGEIEGTIQFYIDRENYLNEIQDNNLEW